MCHVLLLAPLTCLKPTLNRKKQVIADDFPLACGNELPQTTLSKWCSLIVCKPGGNGRTRTHPSTLPARVECNVAKTRAQIYVALSFAGLCHFGVQCTKKYLITRCPLLLKLQRKRNMSPTKPKWFLINFVLAMHVNRDDSIRPYFQKMLDQFRLSTHSHFTVSVIGSWRVSAADFVPCMPVTCDTFVRWNKELGY